MLQWLLDLITSFVTFVLSLFGLSKHVEEVAPVMGGAVEQVELSPLEKQPLLPENGNSSQLP